MVFFWQRGAFNLSILNPCLRHLVVVISVVRVQADAPQHLLIRSLSKSKLFLAHGLIYIPFFSLSLPGQLACGRICLSHYLDSFATGVALTSVFVSVHL